MEVSEVTEMFCKWITETQDPSLSLKIERKWSSIYTDNRLLLRKDLYKRFQHPALLNLDEVPKNLGQNVSISHCPVYGGYVVSDRPIGFDLEQWKRVSHPLVKRTCDETELALLEDYIEDRAIFWSTKESAYKALRKTEGQITEIKLKTIEKITSLEISNQEVHLSEGVFYYKVLSHYKKQAIKTFAFMDQQHDLVGAISYPTTL
ncbi:MAG: 4'-phosphopantetheinyl transferase superfamily protein [Bdellovibrionaceae bacterium]|nr:4'-phosphopantetheinyl transferase superfamily protein [Pseudobdellovibrionaceae bacterium]